MTEKVRLIDLASYYKLDIEDLYFDTDLKSVVDKDGNVWAD